MNIIQYRKDKDSPWVGIPALKGDKGDKGDMPDMTGYATEEYVNDAVVELEELVGVELENYARLTDIPDMSDYATTEYVDKAVDNALASIGIAEEGEY